MTPADIDRVFGRSRLRMVTGDHVEVFREASLPGERRRYTKRFLATPECDFREWTEREWRILARLVGHGIQPVPDVVQFDRGASDRPALVQTFDAGITVDHWATLLPLERDGALLRNVFEDCAHWWSLARHCLIALDAIHELRLVHLDLKADNVCIPAGPADFDPLAGHRSLHPRFDDITLIDFAFSLVSGERLKSALPIAAQLDYEYQSPRLLRALEAGRHGDLGPTRLLDWRCDLFSLAAMLWRYLPEPDAATDRAWTRPRHAKASALVRRLIESHDSELPETRPHAELIALAAEPLSQPDLRRSLQRGWTLAIDASSAARAAPTPVTRIAMPLAAPVTPSAEPEPSVPFESEAPMPVEHATVGVDRSDIDFKAIALGRRTRQRSRAVWWSAGAAAAVLAGVALATRSWHEPQPVLTASDVHGTRVAVSPPVPVQAPVAPPSLPVAASPPPESAPRSAAVPASAPAVAEPTRPVARPAPAGERDARVATAIKPAPVDRGKAMPTRIAAERTPRSVVSRPGAAAPSRPAAFPSPATVVAQARVKALLQQRAEAQTRISPRLAARGAAPSTAPGAATPWAVAGKPPPDGNVAPVSMPPAPATSAPASRAPSSMDAAPVDFASRADDLMVNHVPRLAQRAERLVSRVLAIAGRSQGVVGDREILAAAASLGASQADPVSAMAPSPREARQLDDAARSEYGRRGASSQALLLQARAFGAHPLDPDIAGRLAFLLLRQRPAQAEAARRMALHALTVHGERYPHGRSEDWATLAIASALVGRESEARNALLVSLAMAPDLDRQCRAAIDTYALYGERMRAPVEAMLYSAHASARGAGATFCEWPPHWTVSVGPSGSK